MKQDKFKQLTQKEKQQLKGGGKRGGKNISVPATDVS